MRAVIVTNSTSLRLSNRCSAGAARNGRRGAAHRVHIHVEAVSADEERAAMDEDSVRATLPLRLWHGRFSVVWLPCWISLPGPDGATFSTVAAPFSRDARRKMSHATARRVLQAARKTRLLENGIARLDLPGFPSRMQLVGPIGLGWLETSSAYCWAEPMKGCRICTRPPRQCG